MPVRARMSSAHSRVAQAFALDAHPWHHWLVVYGVLLPFFSAYRGVALTPMLHIFAARNEFTVAIKTSAMVLGVLEDAVLVTMLLVLLSACDFVLGPRRSPAPLETDADKAAAAIASVVVVPENSRVAAETSQSQSSVLPSVHADHATPAPPLQDAEKDEPIVSLRVRRQILLQGRRVLRALVHTTLTLLALVPFAADNVLLRTRGMRFTFAFITTYFRELDYAKGVEIATYEVRVTATTVGITLAAVAAVVTITMLWLDLSQWHIAMLCTRKGRAGAKTLATDDELAPSSASSHQGDANLKDNTTGSEADYVSLEDGIQQHEPQFQQTLPPVAKKLRWKRVVFVIATPLLLIAVLCSALLVLTHHITPVVSATGMNASLNELFRLTFHAEFIQSLGDGKIDAATDYIHTETESYELFKSDVLFRKTTGFKGPLAFDVQVNASNPPNVLVLVVESFRFQDSLYLVGNNSDALRKKQHNVSLTPQFDKWAQRGIALRNLWSSWQTSRSVESILFGQVPFDDMMDSGTTNGRANVELHGMPQLFKQKGYETTFTSGVRIKYDQWNKFLPTHGFDYVMGSTAFKAYGEKDYGIKSKDWKAPHLGGQGRASFWGVHDDVSFDVLGDMLVNKTVEQQSRQRLQDPKKPFFINHYTISSHTPFLETPTWFAGEELPDFSALAEDHPAHAKEIARYAKLRFFEDLALGRFLDRMEKQGVLNDTIVVIVGDHGQSPERGLERPDADEIATTRVAGAIIAEGRLGDAVGMVFDDAVEHYDLLNTLADIVGVPDGGFLQSGVGRSLKRKIPFGERVVYTNNPMRQQAVVKGHERLSFDRQFNMIELYNAENDPDETRDLLPGRSEIEQRQWEALREKDRKLSRYFRVRWDKKCISKVDC